MAVHLKVNHTHTLIEDGNTAGFDGSQHFVINEAGGDYDLRVESDGNQNALKLDSGVYGGVGSLGIGVAPAATPIAHVLVNPPALTIPDNTEYATVHIDNTAAKTVTGATTSAIVAALRVDEPNITATGTVTTAATVYIEGAPTEGGVNHALLVDAGTSRFDGTIYINDDADANVTTGLVINQGAADDSLLTMKSSDVAHGVTTFNETDTFGALAKRSGTDGGLQIRGLSEVTVGISLEGLGATDDTVKTTSAIGYAMVSTYKKSGTGAVDPGANANIFVIRKQATAVLVLDAEADLHLLAQANGQAFAIKTLTELTTIAAAATTSTTIEIPANAVVLAVSARVTTVIPTAATFDIGISGATTRYGTGISTAATTTNPGTNDGARFYSAGTAILITPNLTPGDTTGRLRVTIHYYEVTAPTS